MVGGGGRGEEELSGCVGVVYYIVLRIRGDVLWSY